MIDPTPEQIEAAAKAGSEAQRGVTAHVNERDRLFARAVLVAAAGAAPQKRSDAEIYDLVHSTVWGHRMIEPGGVLLANDAHALAGKVSSALAALVQVDEAKLVEITRSTIDRRPYSDATRSEIRGLEHAVAREIAARSAEWLRGVER